MKAHKDIMPTASNPSRADLFKQITGFIRDLFGCPEGVIPLHAPVFFGNEKKYVTDCIDSTFVSSVGDYVTRFEQQIAEFTGARYAVATVNGTSALHLALLLAGVKQGEEVITQAVTFVATPNAVSYCGAEPVFLDSDPETLGLSPEALEQFLSERCFQKDDGRTYNKSTRARIAACVPMHVCGHPVKIDRISELCSRYHIPLVEDAAESLGSYYKKRHTGLFGNPGILSFNGNKTITTGGGGMIITDDAECGKRGKHLSTTAKISHPWEYSHDMIAFNYRMPNINAALGCAQMEQLPSILKRKRDLAAAYQEFFNSVGISYIYEPPQSHSNYWLNMILFDSSQDAADFISFSNKQGIRTRPLWNLMPDLPIYGQCQKDMLENARRLVERVVHLPSGVRA